MGIQIHHPEHNNKEKYHLEGVTELIFKGRTVREDIWKLALKTDVYKGSAGS